MPETIDHTDLERQATGIDHTALEMQAALQKGLKLYSALVGHEIDERAVDFYNGDGTMPSWKLQTWGKGFVIEIPTDRILRAPDMLKLAELALEAGVELNASYGIPLRFEIN